jgi:hypothetical protein
MQFSTLSLAVIFTSTVIANGSADQHKGKGERHHHHHKIGELERKCDEIFYLERLERLIANSTALSEKPHNNATKIGELQAKASQDASKLATLKGNQTLIVECEVLAAEKKLEHDCFELLKLEHFLKFASNSTEVSNTTKNNGTRVRGIAAEVLSSATKLQQLRSNSTLVALCLIADAHEREKHECEEIKKLEKLIKLAGNDSALADKTKNNVTRIGEIKAESSKFTARLAELQNNATFVSDCAAFGHPTNVAAQVGKFSPV